MKWKGGGRAAPPTPPLLGSEMGGGEAAWKQKNGGRDGGHGWAGRRAGAVGVGGARAQLGGMTVGEDNERCSPQRKNN